jgi:spermidine synthase
VPLLVGVVALSLLLSGFCGIISELSLFNLAEALLGGTNANLTYTMGIMMFAMGVGSAFTAHRLFREVSVELFVLVECALSLVTMASVVAIYFLAGLLPGSAAVWIWTISPLIGLLVGLEIPIVLRINEVLGLRLRLNAALVMAPDYFGSLAAFVLFTFLLLPTIGLGRVAWLGGMLNLVVAGLAALVFMGYLRRPLSVLAAFVVLVPLAVLLGYRMPELMAHAEQLHYRDGIVAARETPYQRVVVTDHGVPGHPAYGRGAPRAETLAEAGGLTLRRVRSRHAALCREDIRLYINGGLQFSTCDEHRYHEMLVHPALGLVNDPREVLVLGGGDGLAVRELLKYAGLRIRLVELDAAIVRLFRDDPRFARLNGSALADPRVNGTVGDAFRFLRETRARYDLIVMDFPDPYQSGTARLYSTQFFRFAGRALAPGGILVTQSTSPLFHPRAFLSIRKTMEAAGFRVVSLQVPMLAFEHWGFQVGSRKAKPGAMKERLEAFTPAVPTRYLNRDAVQAAHRWGKGFERPPAEIPVNDQFTLPLAELYRETLRR